MYITASDTVNIPVEFKGSQGELVVPDAGTFSYTVLRLDGTVVLATQNPSLGANDTEAVITLNSPTTDMVTANDSETLLVKYQYDVSSKTKTERIYLEVTPERKYIITEEDVRNTLGATDITLPDEFIDLHLTYITLKNSSDLGDVDLDTVLLGGGYNAQLANNAIKYASACAGLDKLALTNIKTHTEDNISVTHFEADIKEIKSNLAGKYYEAVASLNPQLDVQLKLVSDLFVVFNPDPDVITGA